MKYIEESAAIGKICGAKCGVHHNECGGDHNCETVDLLKSVPPADVAPVAHGEWVFDDVIENYRCPMCGKAMAGLYRDVDDSGDVLLMLPRFCGYCGAKMGEKDAD